MCLPSPVQPSPVPPILCCVDRTFIRTRNLSFINQDRDMWPPLCLQKLRLAHIDQYQCQTPVCPDQDLSTWGQCQPVTCQLTRVTCLTAEPSPVPRVTMRLTRRYHHCHHLLMSHLPVYITGTPMNHCHPHHQVLRHMVTVVRVATVLTPAWITDHLVTVCQALTVASG